MRGSKSYEDMRLSDIALLLLPLQASGTGTFVICIDSQETFAQMNTMLTKAIADGETDIVMDIAKGVYYYKENHLIRRNENYPDVSISIQGHDAVLISTGSDYRNGDLYQAEFNPDAVFIDTGSLTAFDFWDDCRYAEGMVEVVDEEAKLCRLPVSQADAIADCTYLYVNIPQWFYSNTYKVEKVEQGYLYFTVPDLEYVERGQRSSYNVNYDYLFGGQDIRFRLCNPAAGHAPMQIDGKSVKCIPGNTIHECKAHSFLYSKNTTYKRFTISGLHFLGNSGGSLLIKADSMTTEGFNVEHCRFEAIKGYVLWAHQSPAITFSHNSVENCNNGIYADNSCTYTSIVNNTFSNCGKSMKATFCVNCKGKDYYIANNQFCNFGYAAIGVGVWFGNEKKYESSGVIENNEMWCDSNYIAHKERYTLQDTGALYLWPKNDSVTVRNNYIHDIDGMLLNRGIFCDDGASHFRLYGNVVINIANSYSIDSRNCEKKFPGANEDNRMEGNIVDGPIKFEGSSKANNGCVVSGNVILYKEGEEPPENIYSRLTTERQDYQMTFLGKDQDVIIMERRQMERIQGLFGNDSAIKAAKWLLK